MLLSFFAARMGWQKLGRIEALLDFSNYLKQRALVDHRPAGSGFLYMVFYHIVGWVVYCRKS